MIVKANGEVINKYEEVNPNTTAYLKKFWKLTTKDEYMEQHKQMITYDREWAKGSETANHKESLWEPFSIIPSCVG